MESLSGVRIFKLSASDIQLFDQYRDKRHKTMYSGSYYMSMEDAEKVISFADKFIEKLVQLLGVQKEELIKTKTGAMGIVEVKKAKKEIPGSKFFAPLD